MRQLYRRRFGIELSYRCARSTRGWTTSLNPVQRFLLIALSFFLFNVWVALRWLFAQAPRQGGRWVISPTSAFGVFLTGYWLLLM